MQCKVGQDVVRCSAKGCPLRFRRWPVAVLGVTGQEGSAVEEARACPRPSVRYLKPPHAMAVPINTIVSEPQRSARVFIYTNGCVQPIRETSHPSLQTIKHRLANASTRPLAESHAPGNSSPLLSANQSLTQLAYHRGNQPSDPLIRSKFKQRCDVGGARALPFVA